MTWLSVWMAVIQTYYRLAVHQDRIELATVAVRARDDSIVSSITDTIQVSPRLVLQREVKSILTKAGLQALWAATSGMIPYCFFRRAVFGFTSAIVRNFYRINKSNVPHSWPVGPSFFVRTFWVSFLVFFLWEVVHATFKINYSKEPLIDGKTISESSTDPNGTLVSGLKSHRPFTKVGVRI